MDICRALMLCEQEAYHPPGYEAGKRERHLLLDIFEPVRFRDFQSAGPYDECDEGGGLRLYWAPGVVSHGKVRRQTVDIYSLGIMMYEMLNNRRVPFIRADEPITAKKIDEAMDRRQRGEQVPPPANGHPELKRTVLKACAYRPQDRYASAEEMYADLETLANGGENISSQTFRSQCGMAERNQTEVQNAWKTMGSQGQFV